MRLIPRHPELGWTPYAFLIYLGFFFMYAGLGRGASAGRWAATLLGAALFLVLYFRGFWYPDGNRGVAWVATGMVVLAAIYAPSNPGANVFCVYAAGFLAQLRPARRAIRALLLLLLAIVGLAAALGLSAYFWMPAFVFAIFNGGINLHFAEMGRSNEKLRMTQQEVERLAQTAERERIARDLHDLLGHTLSLITLKSELAAKVMARDPARAEAEIREVERISREALKEVRSAITGYRSEGLPAEMARASLALEAAGVRLEYLAVPVELPAIEETILSLALREAVTNVIRHARANTCRITLEQTEKETRLEVRDDGRGAAAPEGVGLSVMRERVEGLGGRLERQVEGGTVLAVVLPRHRTEENAPGEASAPSTRLAPEGA
jgi:two-component system, NarL family, sensor histidine kinase DesK